MRDSAGAGSVARTILVVEDEEVVRRFFAQCLTRHGYRVLVSANAGEALAILARGEERIDLLLTDLVMPGMGGHELLRRAREILPGLPAVLTSGYPEGAHPYPGSSRFVQKPVSVSSLLRVIREVLEG